MKIYKQAKFIISFIILIFIFSAAAFAQTTTFTYQGKLNDGAAAANGSYLLEFKLFDAQAVGTGIQVGTTLSDVPANVVNGIFTVQLDFGANAFNGADRFLQIAVRRNANESYVTLTPRQPISSVPYAVKSQNANNANLLGGQPPSAYATTADLQTQNIALQQQITQLQSNLAATTGGTQLWSKSLGSTASDVGLAIAVNSSGDIFVTGSFQGTVDFGGGILTSAGLGDIFVAKYSGATGAFIWANRFGSTGSDEGKGLAIDTAGNIFVTGSFQDTVNFGGAPLTSVGSRDVFLVKLSGADGSHISSRRAGGTGDDLAYGVAVDGNGNPVITGIFTNTVDFGGGPISNSGFADIFVAKYNGMTNAHLWSKGFGGTSNDVGQSVATDGSGNVFVTGWFSSSSINFGGGVLTNAGIEDGFLIKLASANGSHIWSKRLGGGGIDESLSLAVDVSGSVFVTGYFGGATIDFGGGPLTNTGSVNTWDIFLVKYDAAGTPQWSKAFGSIYDDLGLGVSLDGGGNPIITGYFSATANFGGISFNCVGSSDLFVAKYAGSSGLHQWSRRYGGTEFDAARAVAVDGAGDIFLTGSYSSPTLDFGGGSLTNAGGFNDMFIAKLKK